MNWVHHSLNKRYFSFLFCCKFVLWLIIFLLVFIFSFFLPLNFWSLLIQLHEFGEIELGLLNKLDLSDQNILDWENLGTFFSDLFSNWLLNEFFGKILEGRLLALIHHNFHHLFADNLLLRALGIAGSLHLLPCSLCETNSEDSEHVSIGGLGLNKGFNDVVPFLDKLAEFVLCDVHSVEVSVAVWALHFFDLDLDLSPGIATTLVLQVSQWNFKDSSFKLSAAIF